MYLEASFLISSKMECFAKTVNGFEPLTIFAKHSILLQTKRLYVECNTGLEWVKENNNFCTKIMNEVFQSREANSNCQIQT